MLAEPIEAQLETCRDQGWFRAALLVGLAYGLIGRLFALPATDVHAWRVAAWVVSVAVYAAHIGYEHFRIRSSPRRTAMHVAVAVAIGAFALVAAGMLHDLWTTSTIRPTWLLAFVVLPAVTALPAFLVGLIVGATLQRFFGDRSCAR
ncbi:MAG: hypothetical protein ABR551_11145 [Gemmatimonadales bacterium]